MSSPEDLFKKRTAAYLQAICAIKYVRKDNFPCQIEEGLFLGSVGGAFNKEALKCLNITHVLIIANSIQPAFPDDFVYKKIEVLDTPDTNLKIHFNECFDFIDEARQAGGGALVHCFAGRSRSATVIIAYLIKQHQMSLSQACLLVKSKRPQIAPNIGFMKQLHNFEKSLGDPACLMEKDEKNMPLEDTQVNAVKVKAKEKRHVSGPSILSKTKISSTQSGVRLSFDDLLGVKETINNKMDSEIERCIEVFKSLDLNDNP